MQENAVRQELEQALGEIPLVDVHTHLTCAQLSARGLADIALYHMVVSDLYSAGCPDGSRISSQDGPGSTEVIVEEARLIRAAPFFERIRNTSTNWMLRSILRDLYDWVEPITESNWRALNQIVRERSADTSWAETVLERTNIVESCTEYARRDLQGSTHKFRYSLEWGMFTRPAWGYHDAPLYELERCWGTPPGPPLEIGIGTRQPLERRITSAADADIAIDWYIDSIPAGAACIGTHISTEFSYTHVEPEAFETVLSRRATATREDESVFASYLNERLLARLEQVRPEVAFMFSLGAEPMPFETGSWLKQSTLSELSTMMARHPNVQFICLLGVKHANQTLCSLARELPNLVMAGYWWHNFYPAHIDTICAERLDMLPLNKQIGFFSDAYTVEWAYAKALMVRKRMSTVLASRVTFGMYSIEEAISIARQTLLETPSTILRESEGCGEH